MKPLHGIKVLDLTHAVAGPFCTYHLHLLGAEVIKLERPNTGDQLRGYTEHGGHKGMSAPFMGSNSGKKSMAIDLSSPEGVEIAKKLAAESDVLVENFRPGATERLGLGYEALKPLNPRLIYASISGFGQAGELKDWSALDHIIQAMSGMMSMNGEIDRAPIRVGFPVCDIFSGHMAAFAITAAIRQRDLTGEGQRVDVSMLDAAMVLMTPLIVPYLHTQEEPRRSGSQGYRMVPSSNTFQTKDDPIVVGANHQRMYEDLVNILGAPELATDERYATHDARLAHRDELKAELDRLFLRHSAADLEPRLAKKGVPVSVMRTIPQALATEHVQNRGILMDSSLGDTGEAIQVVGSGFRYEHDGPAIQGPVPALGQHTDEILAGLGFSTAEVEGLRARGVV
jgi:crotonobetainyl-CoA:carnitine CoA-transferase CaiB-like acyl-CoA transferase